MKILLFLISFFTLASMSYAAGLDDLFSGIQKKSGITDRLISRNVIPHKDKSNLTVLTKDEIHKNIMENHPKGMTMNATHFYDHISKNVMQPDDIVYIEDEQRFAHSFNGTSNVNMTKRQYSQNGGTSYVSSWVQQTNSWFNPWGPASICLWTGYDPQGASETFTAGWSVSTSYNGGISLNLFNNLLSVSLGVTVTDTNSQSFSYTCTIPGNSVGQIWYSLWIGWGFIQSQNCVSYAYGPNQCYADYWYTSGTSPAVSGQGWWTEQLGCSTSCAHVCCCGSGCATSSSCNGYSCR
jgi:hypothetical protein